MRASILWMFVGPLASIVASIGCHSGAPLPEVGDPCARDLDCGGLACDPRSRRCTIAPPREYVATLPGLVLWLEAGSEVTTDGDGLVTTWGDRSRAGNDAVAMARPGAPRRIVDLATGKAAVQFSGSGGTSLQIADSETMRWGHDDYALIAVVRYRNRSGLTANTYGALFVKQCDCNLYVGTAFFLNDPWPAFLEGKPTRTGVSFQVASSSDYVVRSEGSGYNDERAHLFVGLRRDDVLRVRVDGADDGSMATTPMDVSTPGVPATIGANGYGGGQLLNGEIFELVAIAGELTEAELQRIEGYLLEKYGIPRKM